MTTPPCLPGIIPQIQVTLRCNQRCTYCFQQHRGRVISINTVASIFEKAIRFNGHTRPFKETRTLPVYWHGGEPLLAGIDFFKKVIDLQSRFDDVRFENRLQTNGTLMTKALARFFADHRFDVGFSLDGPKVLHNRYRKYAAADKNQGPFDDAMAGIRRYRKAAGIDKVPVICVITKKSTGHAKEIFDFFKRLHASVQLDIYDLRARDLSAATNDWGSLFTLAPAVGDLERFLIELFDLWFYDTSGQVEFKELRDQVKMVLQPQLDLGDPYDKRRCDIRRTIFDPHGNVYGCDQYINDPQTALGNIVSDNLEPMMAAKIRLWEEIKRQVRHAGDSMACGSCRWGRQCSGGCVTCMKYISRLTRARGRGRPDADWIDMTHNEGLAAITGEFYYCDALRALREHVNQSIAQQMS